MQRDESSTGRAETEETAGDEAAAGAEAHEQRIERLFRDHNQALLRFISLRLHSEQEAREIAQEAYVRLLSLHEPDAVSYLRAFLFRIAANLATDRLKQRERRGELRNLVFFEPPEPSPPPESALGAREELEILRSAVEELPPKCRTAFLLHRVHDVPITETAARMQLSVRMVRLYVARALAHCKKRLQAHEREH